LIRSSAIAAFNRRGRCGGFVGNKLFQKSSRNRLTTAANLTGTSHDGVSGEGGGAAFSVSSRSFPQVEGDVVANPGDELDEQALHKLPMSRDRRVHLRTEFADHARNHCVRRPVRLGRGLRPPVSPFGQTVDGRRLPHGATVDHLARLGGVGAGHFQAAGAA
jgi:hypothetical protein